MPNLDLDYQYGYVLTYDQERLEQYCWREALALLMAEVPIEELGQRDVVEEFLNAKGELLDGWVVWHPFEHLDLPALQAQAEQFKDNLTVFVSGLLSSIFKVIPDPELEENIMATAVYRENDTVYVNKQPVKRSELRRLDWGFSFFTDTELDAYRAAYVHRGLRTEVTFAGGAKRWMVTVFMEDQEHG